MKKICVVMYDFSVLGGAEQVGANLANALGQNYEVSIYSILGMGKKVPYQVNKNMSTYFGNCGEYRVRQLIVKNFGKFIHFVNSNRFDIVLAIGGYASAIVSVTRPFTRSKYIFCDHGALMNQWDEKDITFMRWLSAKLSHKIVVLTDATRIDYINHFHIAPKKILRIYNWINPELLKNEGMYCIEAKKILSVGRFGPEKGYDLLVQVAERVLPKHPQWQWEIYGDGKTFQDIYKLVKDKHLDNQLVLKGNVKDVSRIFDQYAIFVLPSYREGLPLVLLEAKVNKLPMVSFDIETGPREIIDRENGVLISPYDCVQMADEIEKLMLDDEYRKRLSEGTNHGLGKFDYHNILKQWIELLESL